MAKKTRKDSADLARIPDGNALKRLECGVVIPRRRKHEPRPLDRVERGRLPQVTDKPRGSKFLPDWTLPRYVQWLEGVIAEQGWRYPPGAVQRIVLDLHRVVGVHNGERVTFVCVEIRGQNVHAWPVKG